MVFTITVNSISVEEVPELTDELVKTLSEDSTTVAEYKEEVKKDLEEQAQTNYDFHSAAECMAGGSGEYGSK